MAHTMLEGKWEEAKGRVKEAWGVLSDDDLDRTEGNWDQLVGAIRQKTGETLETIETKLNEIVDAIGEAGQSKNTTP